MEQHILGIREEYNKLLKKNSILKKQVNKYTKRFNKIKRKQKKEKNNENKQIVKLLEELDIHKTLNYKLVEEKRNLINEKLLLYEDLELLQTSNKKSINKLSQIINKLVSPRILLDGKTKKEDIIYDYQGGKCYYCSNDIKYNQITIEHKIPKSLCKKYNLPCDLFENLWVVCNKCNQERGNKMDDKLFLTGLINLFKNPTQHYPDALYDKDCIMYDLYQSKNLLAYKLLKTLDNK